MIKLRERLDTLESLIEAIDGYQHLPIDVLSQFLLDQYTVDLDILAEFADALQARDMKTREEFSSSETAQSAA